MEKILAARSADLEAWETALRAAVLSAGAKVLEGLLQGFGSGRQEERGQCPCGSRMESQERKTKDLLTILGPVSYSRSMYQCPRCQRTRYPGDEVLEVEHDPFPGFAADDGAGRQSVNLQGRVRGPSALCWHPSQREGFGTGSGGNRPADRSLEPAGARAPPGAARSPVRSDPTIPVLYIGADGTGVPMIPEELQGRKGKQANGSARTRAAKLGCIFTQTGTDTQGYPVRDPDSTSFVGAIESAEPFDWRLYTEALRRGLLQAHKIVALSDGSEWIKNLVQMHFPEALHIIDLYHAREHINGLCKLLFGPDEKNLVQYRIRWWTALDSGEVEKILLQAKPYLPEDPPIRKQAEGELAYLDKNKERMRYATFRAEGLFVGSGVVEAGCKVVIGQRLKRSGMEWPLRGSNAILALRCTIQSGRFEDFWEYRAA